MNIVLTLPGWQGSGPEHWQSRWEALHGFIRVEQHDWMRPLRGAVAHAYRWRMTR